MASDRSLATLLRALQDDSNEQDNLRLLGSAITLLTSLSNPLNITLLTTHLLSAPALWSHPDGVRTSVHVLGVFSSASSRLSKPETLSVKNASKFSKPIYLEKWASAVVNGTDDRVQYWKRLIVPAGLLLGLKEQDNQLVPKTLWVTLENFTVGLLNSALDQHEVSSEMAINSSVATLGCVFPLLSEDAKRSINYDRLLPQLYWAPFLSTEGLHMGYFLSAMDVDIVEGPDAKFSWSTTSTSYIKVSQISTNPLVATLGSLSRTIATIAEHICDVRLVMTMLYDLSNFTRSLCVQWRQNKLCEIDSIEEKTYLTEESLQSSLPLMWRTLNAIMFSIIVILTSLVRRAFIDVKMRTEGPHLALESMRILRNLFFISSRFGTNAFSQYTFIYLTVIDFLSQFPAQSESFLHETKPSTIGVISEHPLDRCHDLFFLNAAEHLSLILTSQANEDLLLASAIPYLDIDNDQRLGDILESAHGLMLALFSAPQNAGLVEKYIHPYMDALFKGFPSKISPRQFRLAIKTLVRITSPPSPVSASQPLLSSVVLELVHMRAKAPSSNAPYESLSLSISKSSPIEDLDLTEQCTMVLSLIDSLTYLDVNILKQCLDIAAESLNFLVETSMKHKCRQRLWEVLTNGEMDIGQATVCVAWWTTQGGRNMILQTPEGEAQVMGDDLENSSKQ